MPFVIPLSSFLVSDIYQERGDAHCLRRQWCLRPVQVAFVIFCTVTLNESCVHCQHRIRRTKVPASDQRKYLDPPTQHHRDLQWRHCGEMRSTANWEKIGENYWKTSELVALGMLLVLIRKLRAKFSCLKFFWHSP